MLLFRKRVPSTQIDYVHDIKADLNQRNRAIKNVEDTLESMPHEFNEDNAARLHACYSELQTALKDFPNDIALHQCCQRLIAQIPAEHRSDAMSQNLPLHDDSVASAHPEITDESPLLEYIMDTDDSRRAFVQECALQQPSNFLAQYIYLERLSKQFDTTREPVAVLSKMQRSLLLMQHSNQVPKEKAILSHSMALVADRMIQTGDLNISMALITQASELNPVCNSTILSSLKLKLQLLLSTTPPPELYLKSIAVIQLQRSHMSKNN